MSGLRIALVPLDERPVCTDLPGMVAAVAGAVVTTPPVDLMPRFRTPGHPAGLARWLEAQAHSADAAVVALETLGHGGLVPSRLGAEPAGTVAHQWEMLRGLAVPVHASTVVMRTPDADDATEEPAYYESYGRALHRLSAVLYEQAGGTADDEAVIAARRAVPDEVRRDFFARRRRNHELNLHALGLAADGVVQTLVVSADDTAVAAVGSAEHQWLRNWIDWLELGDSVLAYPGADEVGAVLVARVLVRASGAPMRVSIEADRPEALDRIAAYENVPVRVTAERQVAAVGGVVVAPEDADLHLLVHAPQPGDWALAPPATTDPEAAAATAARAAALAHAGQCVAVADCAQANGSDPALVAALAGCVPLPALAGYAGWNTAGNTLGTAVAHGVATVIGQRAGTFDALAHQRLLLHRLTEDWAYMAVVRGAVRAARGGDCHRHLMVEAGDPVVVDIESRLTQQLRTLPGFPGWRIRPGSVHLPWQRLFEVGFELEQVP
ncbi:MAG: DUF4127 family protein [Propionicimonas sp.]